MFVILFSFFFQSSENEQSWLGLFVYSMAEGNGSTVIEREAPILSITILVTSLRCHSTVLPFCHHTQCEHRGSMADALALVAPKMDVCFRQRQTESYFSFYFS
jgi:hypothetical protein